MQDSLGTIVVDTSHTVPQGQVQTFTCCCGWETGNRLDFQQHLAAGEAKGCKPNTDLKIHVTDSVGAADYLAGG